LFRTTKSFIIMWWFYFKCFITHTTYFFHKKNTD